MHTIKLQLISVVLIPTATTLNILAIYTSAGASRSADKPSLHTSRSIMECR